MTSAIIHVKYSKEYHDSFAHKVEDPNTQLLVEIKKFIIRHEGHQSMDVPLLSEIPIPLIIDVTMMDMSPEISDDFHFSCFTTHEGFREFCVSVSGQRLIFDGVIKYDKHKEVFYVCDRITFSDFYLLD